MRQGLAFLAVGWMLAGLAACAEQPSVAEHVKAEMIGMTAQEIPVCLGTPVKHTDGPRGPVWSFVYGTCNLDLTLGSDDRVRYASYGIKAPSDYKESETPLSEDEQCAAVPEVASCVRWLRK